MTPSILATYARARRRANVAMWSVAVQCRRLRSAEGAVAEFVGQAFVDFEFLAVALTRLRRAAALAARIPAIQEKMAKAIDKFDDATPGLKRFRDVAEHFDDYALDRGRDQSVKRQSLEVFRLDSTGPTVSWLDHPLSVPNALRASEALFDGIQKAEVDLSPRRRQASARV